jgi:hypothetical protein
MYSSLSTVLPFVYCIAIYATVNVNAAVNVLIFYKYFYRLCTVFTGVLFIALHVLVQQYISCCRLWIR